MGAVVGGRLGLHEAAREWTVEVVHLREVWRGHAHELVELILLEEELVHEVLDGGEVEEGFGQDYGVVLEVKTWVA